MCGIAGVFGPFPEEDLVRYLNRLLGRIPHRGETYLQHEQDAGAMWSLGCNRLAIISAPDSHQPIVSKSGNVSLAYNGEIYNYSRLAPEHSDGDSRALVELLNRSWEHCLKDLDGMFAFAALDLKRSEVLIARDRLGIKPLYYANCDGRFLVASELKALSPEDGVREIFEVPPGHFATVGIKAGSTENPRWIPYCNLVESETDAVSLDALEAAIESSVRDQCAYPGPVGIYLSGGVDSSVIYKLARKYAKVVPLILDRAGGDDGFAARRLCKEDAVDPVIGICPEEGQLFEELRQTIHTVESFEPNVVRQSSVQRHIAAMAKRNGIKVVLCGEGADELFCGYPEFDVIADWEGLRMRFVSDLCRTQLQRVDRCSMELTTEVRVPYLSTEVINIALSCKRRSSFLDASKPRGLNNKICLRSVACGILPKSTALRPKVVLSEGLGLGGNDPDQGLFSTHFRKPRYERLKHELQESFPEWQIRTPEEAYYFSIFQSFGFAKGTFARVRVAANSADSVTSADFDRAQAGHRNSKD